VKRTGPEEVPDQTPFPRREGAGVVLLVATHLNPGPMRFTEL
jgi:hypothetical protein